MVSGRGKGDFIPRNREGYQITKDEYVVIEPKDFDKIKIKSTKSIDIKEFVSFTELDPILIEKSYYIAPDTKKGNDKAYSLLSKVLTDSKKVAIGKIVLRDKENIVALRPYQRGMVMHVLKYLDEIRPTDDITELKEAASSAKKLEREEIALARMLVDKFSSKELDLSEYTDTYTKELEKLIDAKAKGKPIISREEPVQKVKPDLLEALKASMQIKKSK
ncbi:MAG TPA: Ku protein [Nitrososphaeraceae archaeon]